MNDDDNSSNGQESRRSFMKKAGYLPPAILSLQAAPAYAKYGSEKPSGKSGQDGGWNDDKDEKKQEKGKGKNGNKGD